MTLAITRHWLTTTGSVPLSPEDNQRVRSHPERLASGLDEAAAALKGRQSMYDANFPAPRRGPPGSNTLSVRAGQLAKVAGLSSEGSYATTTGTSRADVPCMTTGMGVCTAVVLAGNPEDAQSDARAKVRVFHVFPMNYQAPQQLMAAIGKLQAEGLAVTASMRGGMRNNVSSEAMVEALTETLEEQGVPLVLSQTMADLSHRDRDTAPLGAVIKDNRAIFMDDLRVADPAES